MNAPAAAKRRAPRASDAAYLENLWGLALRYWNVIRPGWPIPVFALTTCALILLSSQGKEALYAVSDTDRMETFATTIVLLIVTSILQYGVFLLAICGYYSSFSDRAMQGVGVRLWSAAIVGMVTPTFLFVFNFMTREFGHIWAPRSPIFEGVDCARRWFSQCTIDIDWQIHGAPYALLAVWVALALICFWFTSQRVRLYLSPFSAIATVSQLFRWVIYGITLACAMLALACFLFADVARLVGPIGLTLLGMSLWAAVWTGAVVFCERLNLPPTPALALTLAVLVSGVAPMMSGMLGGARSEILRFDRNQLDLMPDTTGGRLEDADDYAPEWLRARIADAPSGHVRAIIVLAEGGGIRAALQTATLLSELDAHDEHFFDDLYVLSGVSGGSVGLANYLAARADGARGDDLTVRATEALGRDHLSPVLASMYFWDWPMAFIPAPSGVFGRSLDIYDRGTALESSLQEAYPGPPQGSQRPMRCSAPTRLPLQSPLAGAMTCPFLATVEAAADRRPPPIVLFNTTRTADGDAEVVSNVTFGRESPVAEQQEEVRDERPCNVLERVPVGQTLSMATAAHLSARFPVVSPPGSLRVGQGCGRAKEGSDDLATIIRYVDGGYLDNSGALTASEAVGALERARERAPAVQVNYIVIHILAQTLRDNHGLRANNFLPEVTAPLDGVVGARNLQSLGPIINLCRQVESLRRNQLSAPLTSQGSSTTVSACDRLARARATDRSHYRSSTGDATTYREGYSLGGGSNVSPFWIAAPLAVSDGVEVTDPCFVPLGWVLGRSRAYVEGETRRIAGRVTSLFHAAPQHSAASGIQPDPPSTTFEKCLGARQN